MDIPAGIGTMKAAARALPFAVLLTILPGAAAGTVVIDGGGAGRTFDGLGAISGGGGNSRLLFDYPEPYRSEILDYLFKPNYGASLELLKVEIGGDGNSTSGAEPSHMHSASDEDYNRGYEWWLMEQAKARNPDIKLLALEWTAPGWIGGGSNFWSQDNVDYIVKWIAGAGTYHNLTIDYVGGWNECYSGWDLGWFQSLKNALGTNGFSTKIIGVDEYYTHLTPSAQATISDPGFYEDIDVVAAHYPCDFGTILQCSAFPKIPGLSKPMWASESNGDAVSIARVTNLMYIDGKITASIVWPLVGAVYPNFPWPDMGLIIASEPWSGTYSVQPGVWAMAHTTQFVQPGWRYVDSATGRTAASDGDTGSYVTLVAPNGSDYSIVIETVYATRSQVFSFAVTGGLATGPVHVWSTNLNSANPDDWFVQAQDAAPVNGSYSVTLQPGFLYSITTTTGQSKGSPPAAAFSRDMGHSLLLPYSDDFERYNIGQEARLFADVNGAFEVAPCGGGRSGQCLRQMAPVQPYFWWVTPDQRKASDPYTLMGNGNWADYRVSADILLEQSGAVQLLGRAGYQSLTDPSCLQAYYLEVADQGNWTIVRKDIDGAVTTLASGSVAPLGTNTWHELALVFRGTTISAELDGQALGATSDSSYVSGQIGFGVHGWINAQFDNLSITSPLARMGRFPRR
jgi:hypothetical protein